MSYQSLEEIVKAAKTGGVTFWETILMEDMKNRQVGSRESVAQMRTMYRVMKEADASYERRKRSSSLLVGGDGGRIERARQKGMLLSGDFIAQVMEKAVKMAESNACMKRIVAAPTAGSCGVLPAVLLTYEKQFSERENRMIEAMYVAAGIGEVIAARASISGAEGGCQAEIGSASAMAAGALVYLRGGDDKTICHAVAIALKNLLGLACDPVAGLVEVPCVKRNVVGAVNAVTSCDMAMAGVKSVIPADEVIDAMRQIGRAMPESVRETAEGGLAATATGIRIKKEIQQKHQEELEKIESAANPS